MPSMDVIPKTFEPMYLQPNELAKYGLPSTCGNLVQLASGLIDAECGAIDGDGNGSLVLTTYQERILIQGPITSQILLPMKPLRAVSADTVAALVAADILTSGGMNTGVLANTITKADGTLTPLLAASGRYIPTRRNVGTTNYRAEANLSPFDTLGIFGGAPFWFNIDVSFADFSPLTGEVWFPSTLYIYKFSEVIVTYNAGFDPRAIPSQLKLATAALVKNLMGMGAGTTGLQSFTGAGITTKFNPNAIDDNIKRLLIGFYRMRAY